MGVERSGKEWKGRVDGIGLTPPRRLTPKWGVRQCKVAGLGDEGHIFGGMEIESVRVADGLSFSKFTTMLSFWNQNVQTFSWTSHSVDHAYECGLVCGGAWCGGK